MLNPEIALVVSFFLCNFAHRKQQVEQIKNIVL